MTLPVLPFLILLSQIPGPVGVGLTDDVYGGVAAASITGDAHGGLVAASITGDADGGLVAFSLTGDAEAQVALSGMGRACSNALPKACDENGLLNTGDVTDHAVPAVDAPNPWPVSVGLCDPAVTLFLTVSDLSAQCGGGCSRRVVVVSATALGSASECEGEACDRNVVALNLVVAGDSDLCTSETDLVTSLVLQSLSSRGE